MTIRVPAPDLQIAFATALSEIRKKSLQDALLATVAKVDIRAVDQELAEHASPKAVRLLAAHGLRGELVFPIPLLLKAEPTLLGYYRLLYGYSKKEFYTSRRGLSRFAAMEEAGKLSPRNELFLKKLCTSICESGELLVLGIGTEVSAKTLHELTLLTVGPQLRGGANVKRGTAGIRAVFNVIQEILGESVHSVTSAQMNLRNAAGREIVIEFAADPDIVIREALNSEQERLVVAIEVKAGVDFSNIHNRIGEAEKSHQKARGAGFVECWTVVNVDNFDREMAHRESPSTNRFYLLSELISPESSVYKDFSSRIKSLVGI